MKNKNIAIPVLLLGFVLSLTFLPGYAAQEEVPKKLEVPPEVKTALEAGIQTREIRSDIPFTIIQNIYMPAREKLHSIFLFECKNAALGYAPTAPAVVDMTEKKEDEQSSFEATPAKMMAQGHAFLLFNKLKDGKPGDLVKEVYVPFKFLVDGTEYDAEKVELYSTGYPLAPGDYLLSMALCSPDMGRIGTQYYEFSLPDETKFIKELATTPLFFAKDIQRMQAAELTAEIHNRFFTYSVLQIEPNISRVFSVDDSLDIFFYIFGTKPNPQGQWDIEAQFEVVKDDKVVIEYALQKYTRGPIVSQPLPLTRTIKITTTDEEGNKTEKTEQRKLETGSYALNISIMDNISGNKTKESIQFEIK